MERKLRIAEVDESNVRFDDRTVRLSLACSPVHASPSQNLYHLIPFQSMWIPSRIDYKKFSFVPDERILDQIIDDQKKFYAVADNCSSIDCLYTGPNVSQINTYEFGGQK